MSVVKGNVYVYFVVTLCFLGYIKDASSLECYSCPSKSTANSCQATTSCGQDEVCMLRRTVNNITQEIHYESRCEPTMGCDQELDRYKAILTALVGRKRDIMKQVIAGDVCLIQCCDQDRCNDGCIQPTQQSFQTNIMTSLPSMTTHIAPSPFLPTKPREKMTSQKPSSSTLSSIKFIIPTKPAKTTTERPIVTTTGKPPTISTTAQMTSTKDTPKSVATTTQSLSVFTTAKASSTSTVQMTSTKDTHKPVAITTENPLTSTIQLTSAKDTSKSVATTIENPTLVTTTKAPTTTIVQMTSTKDTSKSVATTTKNPLPEITTTKAHTTSTIQMNSTKDTPKPVAATTDSLLPEITTKVPASTTTSRPQTTNMDHSDIPTTSSPKIDCPYGTVRFNSSCYMFGKREMSFHQAKSFCASHNAYLVHVDSASENEFLKNHFKMMHRGPIQYWIGITDSLKENMWQFYDSGKAALFFDWSPGEPDGIQSFDGNADADCAVFDPYLNYQWRDEDCSPYQYSEPICEIS